MIEEVLSQIGWKKPLHERRFTTSLRPDQGWYAFISMESIHLKPVSHRGSKPDGKKSMLFRTNSGNATEKMGHVILSVPLGKFFKEIPNGVIDRNEI